MAELFNVPLVFPPRHPKHPHPDPEAVQDTRPLCIAPVSLAFGFATAVSEYPWKLFALARTRMCHVFVGWDFAAAAAALAEAYVVAV
jgi:hypothetical protein